MSDLQLPDAPGHRASPPAPSREAGLARLKAFAPRMGAAYGGTRNHDHGPGDRFNVSVLSPHIRRRLVTEREAVATALGAHSARAAEKFVQEVFWRTYWKGWLELRPSVWADYAARLGEDLAALEADAALAERVASAEEGRTGHTAFDAWAAELRETGYLHNHARMWFASIWVFTLALPWRLGADFFLRHLLDGDPASNTLGWRWVAGLQTPGKTYLARPSNITKYTGGRFGPQTGLASAAQPPEGEAPNPKAGGLRGFVEPQPGARRVVIVTEDDGALETEPRFRALDIAAVAVLPLSASRSPRTVSGAVAEFDLAALRDAAARLGEADPAVLAPRDVAAWAKETGAEELVAPYAPVGWTADAVEALRPEIAGAGLRLAEIRRGWDAACWPRATAGFFKFKEKIPEFCDRLL